MSALSHQLPDSALFTMEFNDRTTKYLRGLPGDELSGVSFGTGDVSWSQPRKDLCGADYVHQKLKQKYANANHRARRKSRLARRMELNKLIAFEETAGSDPEIDSCVELPLALRGGGGEADWKYYDVDDIPLDALKNE